MKNSKLKIVLILTVFCVLQFAFSEAARAQETPPKPSASKSVNIPAVREKTLPNGLRVSVVERKNVPLVTVQLLIKNGAEMENAEKAGLANLTASLLTKGTKTRTATRIAEEMEFLGGSINSGAGWNSSIVSVNVMSDKLEQAMAILADVVLNPKFDQKEIDLLKTQSLDNLTYNLKQPGFLANYVASAYSFKEHPAGGTPASLNAITRSDIVDFHKNYFLPTDSVLIFAGDISAAKANVIAQKYFGKWNFPRKPSKENLTATIPVRGDAAADSNGKNIARKILVVDLPNSGQAAVNYAKTVNEGRVAFDDNRREKTSEVYFPAIVLNSVLGGGYSSRLNQEIRIKRGLSYGAGSSFAWRDAASNFATRTQTKNESAAEVAELVLAEVKKLTDGTIAASELNPRKLVLTGSFGRSLETTEGLASAIADLYSFGLPASELNAYMKSVQGISDARIREFAGRNLTGGDVIIVGDAAVFIEDLKKRFPNTEITVIKAAEVDLTGEKMRKN